MNCSMPGLPVHHQLPECTQTHVHWVSDAIQPSHPLSSPSPPALNLSQHQSLFQSVKRVPDSDLLMFKPETSLALLAGPEIITLFNKTPLASGREERFFHPRREGLRPQWGGGHLMAPRALGSPLCMRQNGENKPGCLKFCVCRGLVLLTDLVMNWLTARSKAHLTNAWETLWKLPWNVSLGDRDGDSQALRTTVFPLLFALGLQGLHVGRQEIGHVTCSVLAVRVSPRQAQRWYWSPH